MAKEERENYRENIQFQIVDFEPRFVKHILEILKENFENPWNKNLISNCKISKIVLFKEKPIAYICIDHILDEAEIQMIAVKKEFQGKGVGKFLLKTLIKYLKELEVKKIFLEVNENNETALKFYRRFGFREIYRRKKYYQNKDDAIIMKLDIKEA